MTDFVDAVLEDVGQWYESNRSDDGHVNTNVMTIGLIVSGMLRDGLPVTSERLVSDGGSQVRGLGKTGVRAKLQEYGETRPFTSEGGRTSRGSLPLAKNFADFLDKAVSKNANTEFDLEDLAVRLEAFFVRKIQIDYFGKQTIQVDLDPTLPVPTLIGEILAQSSLRADQVTGVVLQHLVGAKLQLRFPGVPIGQDRATAADHQTGRQGDFEVGTTAFHVTVSPSQGLIDRCKANIRSGVRPVLIVPRSRVPGAEALADVGGIRDRVSIVDGESYIGNNIEEISGYESDTIRSGLTRLIETYNARIEAIESDLSLRLEEPLWMKRPER